MAKDHLMGNLNMNIINVDYTGKSTKTADLIVDNETRKISTDVKKVPHSLHLVKNGVTNTFDGSEDVTVNVEQTQYTAGTGIDITNGTISSTLTGVSYSVVTELPIEGEVGVFYLIPNGESGSNIYDEYIWVPTKSDFEFIGTTSIDLNDYAKKTDVGCVALDAPSSTTLTNEEYAVFTSGKMIKINGTFLGIKNPILTPPATHDNAAAYGYIIGSTTEYPIIQGYALNLNTKGINLNSGMRLVLDKIASVNGKNIPNYPSNTGTFTNKMINGTLSWAPEVVLSQTEYDELETKNPNTFYYILED